MCSIWYCWEFATEGTHTHRGMVDPTSAYEISGHNSSCSTHFPEYIFLFLSSICRSCIRLRMQALSLIYALPRLRPRACSLSLTPSCVFILSSLKVGTALGCVENNVPTYLPTYLYLFISICLPVPFILFCLKILLLSLYLDHLVCLYGVLQISHSLESHTLCSKLLDSIQALETIQSIEPKNLSLRSHIDRD